MKWTLRKTLLKKNGLYLMKWTLQSSYHMKWTCKWFISHEVDLKKNLHEWTFISHEVDLKKNLQWVISHEVDLKKNLQMLYLMNAMGYIS